MQHIYSSIQPTRTWLVTCSWKLRFATSGFFPKMCSIFHSSLQDLCDLKLLQKYHQTSLPVFKICLLLNRPNLCRGLIAPLDANLLFLIFKFLPFFLPSSCKMLGASGCLQPKWNPLENKVSSPGRRNLSSQLPPRLPTIRLSPLSPTKLR